MHEVISSGCAEALATMAVVERDNQPEDAPVAAVVSFHGRTRMLLRPPPAAFCYHDERQSTPGTPSSVCSVRGGAGVAIDEYVVGGCADDSGAKLGAVGDAGTASPRSLPAMIDAAGCRDDGFDRAIRGCHSPVGPRRNRRDSGANANDVIGGDHDRVSDEDSTGFGRLAAVSTTADSSTANSSQTTATDGGSTASATTGMRSRSIGRLPASPYPRKRERSRPASLSAEPHADLCDLGTALPCRCVWPVWSRPFGDRGVFARW